MISTELRHEFVKQAQIGLATTVGAIMGAYIAHQYGTNKTITIAAGSFIGLAAGISLGLIKDR